MHEYRSAVSELVVFMLKVLLEKLNGLQVPRLSDTYTATAEMDSNTSTTVTDSGLGGSVTMTDKEDTPLKKTRKFSAAFHQVRFGNFQVNLPAREIEVKFQFYIHIVTALIWDRKFKESCSNRLACKNTAFTSVLARVFIYLSLFNLFYILRIYPQMDSVISLTVLLNF